jgi:hypothetical protein
MLTTENNMNLYFVDYTYNITGATFEAKYGFVRIKASSEQDAISKARKQAPRFAKGFNARRL